MSIENPAVNRWLTDKAMDHIDHALGRPVYPLRETYRNYFATNVDSALAVEFDASPHWHLSGVSGKMAYFSVTETGRQALAEHLSKAENPWRAFLVSFDGFSRVVPERTAAKAKYAYYLIVSDAWSELTFGAFCKNVSVRRAA